MMVAKIFGIENWVTKQSIGNNTVLKYSCKPGTSWLQGTQVAVKYI